MSGLILPPHKTHLAREKFVELLGQMDLICLPLPHSVSYVSSGSIIDAFAAAKPLITTTNQSHLAIQEKYGEFGVLCSDVTSLEAFFTKLKTTPREALADYNTWKSNTIKIRESRGEEKIANRLIEISKATV